MKAKDILDEIIANKRFEVDYQKKILSPEQLMDTVSGVNNPKLSMREALLRSDTGIIAEFKRKSPSKGFIKENAVAEEIVPSYEKAGAAALSILTDEVYFAGTLKDLRTARPLVHIPIIRKDFIIDEYQLYQAKVVGANAVLLIAAALPLEEYKSLLAKAHELDLEVLLEIHSEKELEYITKDIDMIGINNRNLGTFHTDVENSFRLAMQLPSDSVLVSESGISDYQTIIRLRKEGFKGFLIGESFMKTENPGKELEEYIQSLKKSLSEA